MNPLDVWMESCVASWLPFPKTVYLFVSSKARQSGNYIEACQGAIRVGLAKIFVYSVPLWWRIKNSFPQTSKPSNLGCSFPFPSHLMCLAGGNGNTLVCHRSEMRYIERRGHCGSKMAKNCKLLLSESCSRYDLYNLLDAKKIRWAQASYYDSIPYGAVEYRQRGQGICQSATLGSSDIRLLQLSLASFYLFCRITSPTLPPICSSFYCKHEL